MPKANVLLRSDAIATFDPPRIASDQLDGHRRRGQAAPLFERSREKLRVALYAALTLLDLAVLQAVHALLGHGLVPDR